MKQHQRSAFHSIFILLIIFGIVACVPLYWPDFGNHNIDVVGVAQKGPFQSGTEITIELLDERLDYLGESFSGDVYNDLGYFSIPEVKTQYPVVEVKARGYYFNEINGELSDSIIELSAIADISDSSRVNVNIFTHLISERTRYLVNRGKDLLHAKAQASDELNNALGLGNSIYEDFHLLDISRGESSDHMLFAASLVLQGDLSVSEFSSLINECSLLFKTEGHFNDSIASILFHQAANLETDSIDLHMQNYYESQGAEWSLPYFRDYLNTIKMVNYGRLDK